MEMTSFPLAHTPMEHALHAHVVMHGGDGVGSVHRSIAVRNNYFNVI
jgi:hypothetical protein